MKNALDHFVCKSCFGYGVIEIFDQSTDALIGHVVCSEQHCYPVYVNKQLRNKLPYVGCPF